MTGHAASYAPGIEDHVLISHSSRNQRVWLACLTMEMSVRKQELAWYRKNGSDVRMSGEVGEAERFFSSYLEGS